MQWVKLSESKRLTLTTRLGKHFWSVLIVNLSQYAESTCLTIYRSKKQLFLLLFFSESAKSSLLQDEDITFISLKRPWILVRPWGNIESDK